MPHRKSARPRPHGITDLEEQRRRVAAGTGFFAPLPAHPDVTATYLSLYLIERTTWDETPELGVLRSPYIEKTTGYALPIPDGTWMTMGQPLRVITRLAGLLLDDRTDHALLRRIDPQELTDMNGVYLRWEGIWRRGTLADVSALERRTGPLRDIVDEDDNGERREVRMMTAVMLDGTVVSCQQFRDDPENVSTMIGRIKHDAGVPWMGGDITSGLMYTAIGLLGTLRPPPPEPTEGAMPV